MYHNNNSEKHCISARRLRRIRSQKARKLLVCLTALLCMALAGATVAFLVTQTGAVKNTFQGSKVACAVIEKINNTANDSTEYGKVTGVTSKEDVQIKNTGDTEAWIRAAVVITWQDGDANIYAKAPVAGTDYTITWGDSGWLTGTDGFYYWDSPVKSNDEDPNNCFTGVLIKSIQSSGNPPAEGYYLAVEIIGSAIQSKPASVFEEAWGFHGFLMNTAGTKLEKTN